MTQKTFASRVFYSLAETSQFAPPSVHRLRRTHALRAKVVSLPLQFSSATCQVRTLSQNVIQKLPSYRRIIRKSTIRKNKKGNQPISKFPTFILNDCIFSSNHRALDRNLTRNRGKTPSPMPQN